MFAPIAQVATKFLDTHTRQIFDVDKGKLKNVPNNVIWLVYIMSLSVLVQGLADVFIKVLGYTPLFIRLPWRIDFLFLTALSVLMGAQALKGMRRREFDVTRNSMQVGILVEISLIVSDIVFIYTNLHTIPAVIFTRLPFIILTTINIGILVYVTTTLRLFIDKQGKLQLL